MCRGLELCKRFCPGGEHSDRGVKSACIWGSPQNRLRELRSLTGEVFLTVENRFHDFNLGRLATVKGVHEIGPALHVGQSAKKPHI